MNVKEAAEALGVKPSVIYARIHRGTLQTTPVVGGVLEISPAALEASRDLRQKPGPKPRHERPGFTKTRATQVAMVDEILVRLRREILAGLDEGVIPDHFGPLHFLLLVHHWDQWVSHGPLGRLGKAERDEFYEWWKQQNRSQL